MTIPSFLGQPSTPDDLHQLLAETRAEGFKAGQEAMRERAAQVCPDRTDHEWVRDSLWGRVAERMKQLIYTLPIEEPK